MAEKVLQIANSWGLWLCAFAAISLVLLQALLFTRLAFKSAEKIGFPKEKCMQGLRSGLITAIGPSIAVLIVMVGMMSILGGPITWLRLSMIGSAATELTAAKLSAEAIGVTFGSPEFDGIALSNAYWAMAINGIGWLLMVSLFASRMEVIRQKMGGGDARWLSLIGLAASLGAFAYLNSEALFKSFIATSKGIVGGFAPALAVIGGMFGMLLMLKLSKKMTWLKEYSLGIAMLIGMIAAMFGGM